MPSACPTAASADRLAGRAARRLFLGRRLLSLRGGALRLWIPGTFSSSSLNKVSVQVPRGPGGTRQSTQNKHPLPAAFMVPCPPPGTPGAPGLRLREKREAR